MILTKINDQTVEFDAIHVIEFWWHAEASDMVYSKVVVQEDEATSITYKIKESPNQIQAMIDAEVPHE